MVADWVAEVTRELLKLRKWTRIEWHFGPGTRATVVVELDKFVKRTSFSYSAPPGLRPVTVADEINSHFEERIE